MRRIIAFAIMISLCLICVSNCLADEILFRNLPWGSNPDEMEKELSATGFLYPISSEGMLVYLDKYLEELDRSHLDNSRATEQSCGWASAAYNFGEDGPSVAGYNIGSVQAYFYSPIENNVVNMDKKAAKLYLAQYNLSILDYDTAFDELSNKLSKLYGEPEQKLGKTSAWLNENDAFLTTCDTIRLYYYGDNNSVVVLEKVLNDEKGVGLAIVYGQSGHDDHIAKCDEIIKQKEYQERLDKEQGTDRSDDFGGL